MTASSTSQQHGRFLHNVNWVFLSTVGSFFVGFLAGVVVTRALTPSDRGVLALFQTAVILFATILSLGVNNAVIYFVGRAEISLRTSVAQIPYVLLFSGVCSSVAGSVAYVFLWEQYALNLYMIPLSVVAVEMLILANVVSGIFVVLGRFTAFSVFAVVRPATFLAMVLLPGLLGRLSLDVAIAAWSLGQLVVIGGTIAVLFLVHPHVKVIERLNWPLLRRMLTFGLKGQGANLAQLLNYRLDSFIVLAFVDRAGVAYYAIATAVAEALWYLPQSITTVLLRHLTQNLAPDSPRFTAMVSRITLVIVLAGALALAAVSPLAVPLLFGAEYANSVPALYALLPGILAGSASKLISSYIFSVGQVHVNAAISVIGLVLTVLLDLALIPLFGIVGAALASSMTYILMTSLSLWFFHRISGHPVIQVLLPQRGDITEVMEQVRRFPLVAPILRRLA